MSDPILRLAPLAESCVLVKQLLEPGFCDPSTLHGLATSRPQTLLLPKLRSQLAEFLNNGYPVHLSLLS